MNIYGYSLKTANGLGNTKGEMRDEIERIM